MEGEDERMCLTLIQHFISLLSASFAAGSSHTAQLDAAGWGKDEKSEKKNTSDLMISLFSFILKSQLISNLNHVSYALSSSFCIAMRFKLHE